MEREYFILSTHIPSVATRISRCGQQTIADIGAVPHGRALC
jgi:hypothetical protein